MGFLKHLILKVQSMMVSKQVQHRLLNIVWPPLLGVLYRRPFMKVSFEMVCEQFQMSISMRRLLCTAL